MNCVLLAKMDQVLVKKQNTKKYWKIGKNTGKVREFCQSGKVGTLIFNGQDFFLFDRQKISPNVITFLGSHGHYRLTSPW